MPTKLKNLLLTGPPGVGKTTVVAKAAALLAEAEVRARGFVTEEVREGGGRVGFALVPLPVGERRIFAHRDFVSLRRVGRYGVDVDALDYVVDVSLGSYAQGNADIVVVDEIGKMECFSRRFITAVTTLLEGELPLLATVGLSGGGFMAEVRQRSDCELWTVDRENRDGLPEKIVRAVTSC